MSRLAACAVLLVACGGASTPTREPPPIASQTPTASATASAPPPPAHVAPEGFQTETGTDYTLDVPKGWTVVERSADVLTLRSPEAADTVGMMLQVRRVAFSGSLDEFTAGIRKGVEMKGGKLVSQSTLTVEGKPLPLETFRVAAPGPTIRGVIRAVTTKQHVLAVACHAAVSNWNDKARAACDPIFASIRTDPAPGAKPPRGSRFLQGADFHVTVPASWTDEPATAPNVVGLAKSTNDEHTMIVATVSEIAPSQPITAKTRDADLAMYVEAVKKTDGIKASVKHTGPNLVDIDFERALEGPSTTMMSASYAGAGAGFVVVCSAPSANMLRHIDVCQTPFESMRVRH